MSIGVRLDQLLSTADNGFNRVMQTMIWKHTPNEALIPDEGIIGYMEVLHKIFLFCSDNYKTPYACIECIVKSADTDEYLICLVDSILHIITQSDQGEKMSVLYGQLIDFRHKIAPWDEDESIKAIMAEVEEPEIKADNDNLDYDPIINIDLEELLKGEKANDPLKAGFETYIDECHRDRLMPYLLKYYTGQKPKQFGYMLYALRTLDIIKGNFTANQTQLHDDLTHTFGNIGSRQRLQQLINELGGANTNEELNIRRHIVHIKAFLQSS